jgi:hypothetical protein
MEQFVPRGVAKAAAQKRFQRMGASAHAFQQDGGELIGGDQAAPDGEDPDQHVTRGKRGHGYNLPGCALLQGFYKIRTSSCSVRATSWR